MARYYAGDPHWITARFTSTCARCQTTIKRGDGAWYYPKGRHIYCTSEGCGKQEARAFQAAVEDENLYNLYR